MLKGLGYPDADHMIWNPVAVFIRNWGWFAMLLPALWFGISLRFTRKNGYNDLGGGHLAVIICVTATLMIFYMWTAMSAGYPEVRVMNVDM
ncbi:hypothetical protein NT6N_23940 [Oceaniferula spumae]|uniref:Uncharacterized protein n=1 Tax=Oceaniferula spumae TaxID=2979115 RepID=A0AAT9FN72_9BACT